MRSWLRRLREWIDRPPFQVGDWVRFEPDDRALGWTQDLRGLYPGYVGRVTRLERGTALFEWGVYVDDKELGFLSIYYRRAEGGEGASDEREEPT